VYELCLLTSWFSRSVCPLVVRDSPAAIRATFAEVSQVCRMGNSARRRCIDADIGHQACLAHLWHSTEFHFAPGEICSASRPGRSREQYGMHSRADIGHNTSLWKAAERPLVLDSVFFVRVIHVLDFSRCIVSLVPQNFIADVLCCIFGDGRY
jgi:hypothetical protein